ncbi:protein NDNF-like [Callorhinchus milii]|nr:protein NDNF-like [Callorhinchus milii]XP_007895617.1 protein NDNF-like [Callorhinchus milii]|eukprot:gi/632936653/ref/XP_007895616.1/ PREDICTED: protein NDNF-like [Callorhinchus milii]
MAVCKTFCLLFMLMCQAQGRGWDGTSDRALYNYSPVLPDGMEITVFLFRNLPQRHYFVLKTDTTPFSITVTPCDAPLEWHLAAANSNKKAAGKGSDGDAYKHGKLQKHQQSWEAMRDLFIYKGNAVETYVSVSSHSTFYRLELTSTEKNTRIRVYMTTSPQTDPPYPELPFDPRVDVTSVGQTMVTLAWKPSPSILRYEENIQYCLLINQEHNYKSLCAAEAQVESSDDLWPDIPVVSIFSSLQEIHVANTKGYHVELLSPSKSSTLNSPLLWEKELDIIQQCIGNKNVYVVSDLQPNTQYYFDVFAVNILTNTSTAYTGTFAKTLQQPDPKVLGLKEGNMIQVYVGKEKQKVYSFRAGVWNRRVQFTFYSCGEVHVQIERNGKLLVSENIESLKHFQLRGKAKARYVVGIKSMESFEASVKILVSTHFNKPIFPQLPESLKLKTFDKLRTCNSVTIAWLGTQERNKYCLYKTEIEQERAKKEIRKANGCFGPEVRNLAEKVHCKYFHNLNKLRAVTTEEVRGLEPGKIYLFDVYVIGHTGHSVKYQSKLVKTRKVC